MRLIQSNYAERSNIGRVLLSQVHYFFQGVTGVCLVKYVSAKHFPTDILALPAHRDKTIGIGFKSQADIIFRSLRTSLFLTVEVGV